MIEKIIHIDGDPMQIYGTGDRHWNQIVGYFPKLRIVARGETIRVTGDEEAVAEFDKRFAQLAQYQAKYGHVSKEVIAQIFEGGLSVDVPVDKDVIVFGNGGNIIRARTPGQRQLVRLSEQKDLLFAVGPAGSGKTYTAIALAVR